MTGRDRDMAWEALRAMIVAHQRLLYATRDSVSLYAHVEALTDDMAAIGTDLAAWAPERRGRPSQRAAVAA